MLANFKKTEDELETDTDRWLFALKDERMTTGKLKIEPFKVVSDIAKSASGNVSLKVFYTELYSDNIEGDKLRRYEMEISETNELRDRILAAGEANGDKIATLRIAKNLKDQNADSQYIATVTGLSVEEIQHI